MVCSPPVRPIGNCRFTGAGSHRRRSRLFAREADSPGDCGVPQRHVPRLDHEPASCRGARAGLDLTDDLCLRAVGTSVLRVASPGEAYAEVRSCPMNALVTGATGFVGANVARLLVAEGYRVRVLARPTSSLRALEGCAVEVVRGDILDPASVAGAVTGCAQVFHVAADYRLWAKDPAEIYRNNVDGTRIMLEACAQAGVERVVYTSSVGTLGVPGHGGLGTETTPVCLDDMIGAYKRSKFLAERVTEEYAERGLPVVIVN